MTRSFSASVKASATVGDLRAQTSSAFANTKSVSSQPALARQRKSIERKLVRKTNAGNVVYTLKDAHLEGQLGREGALCMRGVVLRC